MKKYLLPISLIFIIGAFLLGFIEIDTVSIDKKTDNVINYGLENISDNLKNITNLSKRDQDIICAVSRGLVSKNIDNNIVPSLAKEIIKSEDEIEYEFKINDNIYWSDGSKITSNDIVVFFRELLKEEDEKNISALLDVYGAKEFREGKTTFEKGVAIKSKDNSVIIRLNSKNDKFLDELTKPQYRLRKYLIMWENMKKNYNELVYSGEYKITLFENDKVTLESNYDSDNKKVINLINDSNVELSMASFEVGERDLVVDPPQSQLNKLSNDGNLITIPKNEGVYLYINDSNNISLQGRREIYKYISKSMENYLISNDKSFELAEGSYFREDKDDLTKLQTRKVISNKQEEWSPPKVLTILCKDNTMNRELCRIIEKWFRENTRIFIKYSLLKEDEFNDEELQRRYDMILFNNEANILNKDKFYKKFINYMSESEKETLLSSNNNDEEYLSIENKLFREYRIVPLIFYNENIAFSRKVSSIKMDGNGNIDFSTIIN
ncbi:ABC transporter substrate-binding protein [Clostridium taeniosporum]|uniref:Peptide ABC transporter substrate-binding protein n=1 Tax=Clostridium taeniosporum TaxID=394958 RepID=A0A1D7XHG0_9CLOT|nr:ABC transporter substrate-binding protein [Clostridium taeniosporum]AOR22550.1 peptide ABC transporter substrate-binding protein [Clostridium taeniosporum]